MPESELYDRLSRVIFYPQLFVIFAAEPVVGFLLEKAGRRLVTSLGLVISSFALGLMVLPEKEVWLYPIRFTVSLGLLPILASPLISDYVAEPSRGLATGYSLTAAIAGITLATQLLPLVPTSTLVLYAMVCVFMGSAAFMGFALKEVRRQISV